MTGEEIAVTLTRHEDKIKSLEHRVHACECENESIRKIALSVNKLAVNMEHMLTEQKEQGKRLNALERAPAEGYRRLKDTLVKCVISSVVGALIGAVMTLVVK